MADMADVLPPGPPNAMGLSVKVDPSLPADTIVLVSRDTEGRLLDLQSVRAPTDLTPLALGLVPLTLVPVEIYGDCGHPSTEDHTPETCTLWGYGLSDAVSVWSDCNRAIGRIYRVEDLDGKRAPGESIQVWVPRAALPWFERRWGTP